MTIYLPDWFVVVCQMFLVLAILVVLPEEIVKGYKLCKRLRQKRRVARAKKYHDDLVEQMNIIRRAWNKSPAGFARNYGHRGKIKIKDLGDGRTLHQGFKDVKETDAWKQQVKWWNSLDWREPEAALAWGIMYRAEDKPGWMIKVERANGHVIMDTTEWWMLMDRKNRWIYDIFMTDVYGPTLREGLRQHHEAEEYALIGGVRASKNTWDKYQEARFGGNFNSIMDVEVPEDLWLAMYTLHPRYEVLCHLDGTTWIWNQERYNWTQE